MNGPELSLRTPPPGRHRLEIAALDRGLREDPTPAVIDLNITGDPSERLAGLVTALAAADFAARESAVQALAEFGANALPALRAARPSRPPGEVWWIDAAIQKIELRQRKASTAPATDAVARP